MDKMLFRKFDQLLWATPKSPLYGGTIACDCQVDYPGILCLFERGTQYVGDIVSRVYKTQTVFVISAMILVALLAHSHC